MQGDVPFDAELRMFVGILKVTGRSGGLSLPDTEDFIQHVHVRLLETDYAAFRRFKGQSAFKTYLSVVANHLVRDWKNRLWGKWRPSAQAVRLGDVAVALERMTARDGLTVHEAIATLRCRPDAPSTAELEQVARALPPRNRRQTIATDVLDSLPHPDTDDPLIARAEWAEHQARLRVLGDILDGLSSEDRKLISSRYLDGRRVPELARELGEDPKAVYRRCERLLGALRREFVRRGAPATGSHEC